MVNVIKTFKNLIITALLLFSLDQSYAVSAGVCRGTFVNPITDVCWLCIFPITIGSVPVAYSTLGLPDTTNPISPVQVCPQPAPPYYRVAMAVGYWEPSSLVDVTRVPYCMVNMGFEMDLGINMQQIGGQTSINGSGNENSFYHVHWYRYPVMYWLQMMQSSTCKTNDDFDLAYISELDPMWDDDLLSFYLNPEAILFGNPIVQLACAADALITSTGHALAIDALFWCQGSQGSTYPLTGRIIHRFSNPSNAVLMDERMNFKLHREGLVMDSIGADVAVCYNMYSPILPKSRYRYQFTNVIPEAYLCHPYGQTTFFGTDSGRDSPLTAENFGLLNFKKRNCAASY